MNGDPLIGVALAAAACIQSGLPLLLDRIGLARSAYMKTIDEQTSNYSMDGLKEFFHDQDYGYPRISAIAEIGSFAGSLISQVIALIVSCFGLGALAVIADWRGRNIAWAISSWVLVAASVALLVILLGQIFTGRISRFTRSRPSPRFIRRWLFSLDTPKPYLTFLLVVVIYSSFAASFLG